jgi:hypothetical protein
LAWWAVIMSSFSVKFCGLVARLASHQARLMMLIVATCSSSIGLGRWCEFHGQIVYFPRHAGRGVGAQLRSVARARS